MQHLILVWVGGAVGSGMRYFVAVGAARRLESDFPWGTLAVNLVGAFLIGLVQHLAAAQILSEKGRLLLSTGVMGGLTTDSAFSYETVRLAQLGDWRMAGFNVVATTILCLALCVAGMALGRLLTR